MPMPPLTVTEEKWARLMGTAENGSRSEESVVGREELTFIFQRIVAIGLSDSSMSIVRDVAGKHWRLPTKQATGLKSGDIVRVVMRRVRRVMSEMDEVRVVPSAAEAFAGKLAARPPPQFRPRRE